MLSNWRVLAFWHTAFMDHHHLRGGARRGARPGARGALPHALAGDPDGALLGYAIIEGDFLAGVQLPAGRISPSSPATPCWRRSARPSSA
jgi:hypothetical protein